MKNFKESKIGKIAKKIKNIIWYSYYYDSKSNCIIRNRRIDKIDLVSTVEAIITATWIIACVIVSIFLYCIMPYIIAFLLYLVRNYH